ncbi:MAG TPA: YceI family protein [Candidatus Acidoferrales bacterium]|nr:YceI family protein [Candidatus Acidoferrales bacterium]
MKQLPNARFQAAFLVSPCRGKAASRLAILCGIACGFAIFVAPARAQQSVYTLDPAQTKIEFTVDSTLHTVHGTFQLKSGSVQFDPASGAASGAIVVDAASGNSDNSSRDKKMHEYVLEVLQFPEVTFTPGHVKGAIAPSGSSQISVSGKFRLHGVDHDITMPFNVQHLSGNQLRADTQFDVPFLDWGLRDPSNFLLHVARLVHVQITATGTLAPASEAR